jgi:hypothetical protein
MRHVRPIYGGVMKRILFLTILFISSLSSAEYSKNDKLFKDKYLGSLTPWGPGYNENQSKIWIEFIRISVQYDDYEIISKMFSLKSKTDGAIGTQYSLDLFKIFKKDPCFFVQSVNRYYHQNPSILLSIWINETGDISYKEINQIIHPYINDVSMREFLNAAKELNNKILNTR